MGLTERVFEALASPIRRQILVVLGEGELAAGDIAGRFDISKPAISQHLSVLEAADLVSRRKKGQFVFYSLMRPVLSEALNGLLAAVGSGGAPAPAAPVTSEPVIPAQAPAQPGVPIGFRWEAWRTKGNP